MSRSYKKTPYCGDNKGTENKRNAWKKVRSWLKNNPEEVISGGNYKKLYETWDICDYYWICSWQSFWENEIELWKRFDEPKGKPFPNEKECYQKWVTTYKTK